MPTTDAKLAAVMRALLSTGAVTLEEDMVTHPGYRAIGGHRLTVNSSVVLDGMHSGAVLEAM